VADIDKIAGLKQRTSFIVDLLEREIRRHDQIEALREGCGPVYDPSRDVLGSIVFKMCWGINGTENQVKVTRVFADSVIHRPSVTIQAVAVSPSAFPMALTNFRPN
jgi:hypothetical protein